MERKPCVFASFRGQLELLNCISRVSEGSEQGTALHRLGQAEVIAPVQVDVLVHQRGKTLDVLVSVAGVPERDRVDDQPESPQLIFLSFIRGRLELREIIR